MDLSISEEMRADWNRRAAEDAFYYVAWGRRKQNEAEFVQTANEVVAWLGGEIARLDSAAGLGRALEIGCGPGRLMRPLAAQFEEIHGVDVSDQMIQLAESRLKDIPHAHCHHTSGSDLANFPDDHFDFVYSYAVFQHIPSRDIVFSYMREARRVLKLNGIMACQFNGLRNGPKISTSWEGVSISAEELTALAREMDCQILALDRAGSRYMWTTWRKREPGWKSGLIDPGSVRILRAESSGPSQPIVTGRAARLKITLNRLPEDCDLADLSASVQGLPAQPAVITRLAESEGADLVVVAPSLRQAGSAQVELFWRDKRLCEPGCIEVGASVREGPRVVSLTDAVNYLSGRRIISRAVKVVIEDVAEPGRLRAAVNGIPAICSFPYCADPQNGLYELSILLPRSVRPGAHRVELFDGEKLVAPLRIDVGVLRSVDAFRGVPGRAHLLELEIPATGAGESPRCTAVTVPCDGMPSESEIVVADMSRLPFSRGQFDGVVCRWNSAARPLDGIAGELRRVLKEDGGFYLEVPAPGVKQTRELATDIGGLMGLACSHSIPLARWLAPRELKAMTRAATWSERFRAWRSLGLRAMDRWLGTELARGGVGMYFGKVWTIPDLRPRLNGCVACGAVHSSDQLKAADALSGGFLLQRYFCPSCGCSNIFTLDR